MSRSLVSKVNYTCMYVMYANSDLRIVITSLSSYPSLLFDHGHYKCLFQLQTPLLPYAAGMTRCSECGFMDGEIRVGAKPCDTCTSKFRTSPTITTNNGSASTGVKSLLTENQHRTAGKRGGTTPNQNRRKQTPKSTKVSYSNYFLSQ